LQINEVRGIIYRSWDSTHTCVNYVYKQKILCHIDQLLRGDSVNNSLCSEGPTTYACAMASHDTRRCDAGGVFWRSVPRLYNSTVFCWASECSAVEGSPVEC
jgi:hypothetical protein